MLPLLLGGGAGVPKRDRLPILEAIISYAQWQRENGQFFPNPATWLSEGRWEDEEALPRHRLSGCWMRRNGKR